MSRLMVDDSTKTDARAALTTAKMASINQFGGSKPDFLTWLSATTIKIVSGLVVCVNGNMFKVDSDTTLNCVSYLWKYWIIRIW